jgi:hypothetical protein
LAASADPLVRQRDIRDPIDAGEHRDELLQITPQQWLAAGQPDL